MAYRRHRHGESDEEESGQVDYADSDPPLEIEEAEEESEQDCEEEAEDPPEVVEPEAIEPDTIPGPAELPELPKGYAYADDGSVVRRKDRRINTDPSSCDRYRAPAFALSLLSVVLVLYVAFGMVIDVETGYSTTLHGLVAGEGGDGLAGALFWLAVVLAVASLAYPILSSLSGLIVFLEIFLAYAGVLADAAGAAADIAPLALMGCALAVAIAALCSFGATTFAERYANQFVGRGMGAARRALAYIIGRRRGKENGPPVRAGSEAVGYHPAASSSAIAVVRAGI